MSDFSKMEVVTSVDLNYDKKGKKPVYHLVYASQLYGTVFAVYGRFQGKRIVVGGKDAYKIEKISLALLNYKGIINIGFTKTDFDWLPEGKKNNFYFGVQGTSTSVDHTYSFSRDPLVVKKGSPSLLIFNRTLQPLPDFKGFLHKRSRLRPNPSSQLKVKPPVVPLFDSEFNDRDGLDFYNSDLKPGLAGYKGPGSRGRGSLLITPPRCIRSNVRLIY